MLDERSVRRVGTRALLAETDHIAHRTTTDLNPLETGDATTVGFLIRDCYADPNAVNLEGRCAGLGSDGVLDRARTSHRPPACPAALDGGGSRKVIRRLAGKGMSTGEPRLQAHLQPLRAEQHPRGSTAGLAVMHGGGGCVDSRVAPSVAIGARGSALASGIVGCTPLAREFGHRDAISTERQHGCGPRSIDTVCLCLVRQLSA